MAAVIRDLERRDLAELVALCREHAEFERANWIERERATDLGAILIDAPDAWCWVVEGRGELAGFASATLERSTWDAAHFMHLDCLYLRPSYRGSGIGRELVQLVARLAVERGVVNLQWQTPAWNVRAVSFYERLGAGSTEKVRFTLDPAQCAALQVGGPDGLVPPPGPTDES